MPLARFASSLSFRARENKSKKTLFNETCRWCFASTSVMDDCPAGVVVVFAPSFSAMDPAGQRARTCGLMYSTRSKLYVPFKLYTVLIFTIHLDKHYI